MTITRFCACFVSRILYFIVALWMGLLLYLTIFSIIYLIINSIHTLSSTLSYIIVIGCSVAVSLYGLINACFLRVRKSDVIVQEISDELCIAHLSDLHLGAIYGSGYVKSIVDILREHDPDCVVITGDLFDGSMKVTPDMVTPFNKLRDKPIFFIMGNHDEMVEDEDISKAMAETQIKVLRNQSITFKGINFIGVDYYLNGKTILETANRIGIRNNMPNVLLTHVPNVKLEDLERNHICLQLAGHTHGGQLFPGQIWSYLLFTYLSGLYKSDSGKTYVNVSSGTGTAGPPMRILSESQICLITLKNESYNLNQTI